jgi:hypothetical protein
MNSAQILISVLNEDISMGSQTLVGEQKETSYSPDVFLKKLNTELDLWEQILNSHIAEIMSRNHVPAYMAKTTGLPFAGGHLYLKDIDKLRKTLQAYKETFEKILTGLYPEKWYALLHYILVDLGKEVNFKDKTKNEIIAFGKEKYKTDQGFQKAYKEISTSSFNTYLNGLPQKDKKAWKDIIKEISGNNIEVISWTKNKPKF